MQSAQHGGQVQGHDRGTDGDLERERRQGQRHRRPNGRLAPVPREHRQQTHDYQQTDDRGHTPVQQLNGGRAFNGKAEAATAERPGIAGAAGTAAHHQRSGEDQEIGAAGRAAGASS